jgi:hypothetical protein
MRLRLESAMVEETPKCSDGHDELPITAWGELRRTMDGVSRGWRELLNDLGYDIEPLKPTGYLSNADRSPGHRRPSARQRFYLRGSTSSGVSLRGR